MDKETLSNYGWIVICVLVLAVMIALASPFGSYVASAVENTTQGLFDVEQNALGVAGMDIADQSFDDASGDVGEPLPTEQGWADLIQASKDGTYTTKYPVGTLVTLELKDSSTAQFRIVGIDHDDLADRTGKAHLTLISENTLVTHNMNSSNAGGWEASAMRTYLNGDYMNTVIPDAVAGSIKSVSKKSFDRNGGSGISQTTSDKLWIPSFKEVGFKASQDSILFNTEGGSAYAYFTNNASRAKTNRSGLSTRWWLRSADDYSGYRFCDVYADGTYNYCSSDYTSGVAIGFCI